MRYSRPGSCWPGKPWAKPAATVITPGRPPVGRPSFVYADTLPLIARDKEPVDDPARRSLPPPPAGAGDCRPDARPAAGGPGRGGLAVRPAGHRPRGRLRDS